MLSFCNARQMTAPEAYIRFSEDRFSADGEVIDPSTWEFLRGFRAEFRDHIQRVLTVLPRGESPIHPAVKSLGTPRRAAFNDTTGGAVGASAGLSRGLSASSLEGWYCFYVAARLLSEDDLSVVDRAQYVGLVLDGLTPLVASNIRQSAGLPTAMP